MIRAELTERQRVELLLHLDVLADYYAIFQRNTPRSHNDWWQAKVDSARELHDYLNELRPEPTVLGRVETLVPDESAARIRADLIRRGLVRP